MGCLASKPAESTSIPLYLDKSSLSEKKSTVTKVKMTDQNRNALTSIETVKESKLQSKTSHKTRDPSNMKEVKCIYDFTKTNPGTLGITKGQTLYIIDSSDPEWWLAYNPETGEEGTIPKCFVCSVEKGSQKETVEHLDFYFPDIERSEAEQMLLLSELPGTFLVRPSTRIKEPYTLSVSDADRIPKHYKIVFEPELGYFINREYNFPSLKDLVEYHQTNNDSRVPRLVTTIPKCPPFEAGLGKDVWEVDYSTIKLERRIGDGNFGEVWAAKYHDEKIVAVKTFKGTSMAADDFLKEVSMMKQIQHKRLVRLLGVCSKSMPMFMVLEFMSHGNLKNYLKSRKPNVKVSIMLSMANQICEGMEYLESKKIIHRDLAARNVLISKSFECKLADFGLAILQGQEIEKESAQSKFPVKWTAPEAFNNHGFSSKSDVWSYGVVLWEIFSFGEDPYAKWKKPDVCKYVMEKKHLLKPKICPDSVYEIMVTCWTWDPNERPSFAELRPSIVKEEKLAGEKSGLYNEI